MPHCVLESIEFLLSLILVGGLYTNESVNQYYRPLSLAPLMAYWRRSREGHYRLKPNLVEIVIVAALWSVSVVGPQNVASGDPARKDGFNELFITAFILNKEGNSAAATGNLNKIFGSAHPSLTQPNVPELDLQTINHWIDALSNPTTPTVRGSTTLIRDIVDLNYIEPEHGKYPFEDDIVAVLSIYKAHGISLLLAFGMSNDSGHFNEPAWVTQQVQSASPLNQMFVRMQIYADIIARFVQRLIGNYADDSWRRWLKNSVRIEPINEFNVNISGYQAIAAFLDKTVKNDLAANGTALKVVASSIISGRSEDYLNWFREYYRSGAPTDALPNIHLYYSPTLDNGRFENSLQRFKSVIDGLYAKARPGASTKIIIGEVGQPAVGSTDGLSHGDLIRNMIDNPRLIDFENKIDALAFWRLFATFIPLDCVKFAASCGPVQAKETTFGFVHLPTKGDAGLAGTDLYIEPQLHRYYGL